MRNKERYSAFYPAVPEAFLEGIISCVLIFSLMHSATVESYLIIYEVIRTVLPGL